MLCGYPPFNGDSRAEIATAIKEGKLEFLKEDWNHISKKAKDLIKKLLTNNYNKRISAKQAIEHTWFKKQMENNVKVEDHVVKKTLT